MGSITDSNCLSLRLEPAAVARVMQGLFAGRDLEVPPLGVIRPTEFRLDIAGESPAHRLRLLVEVDVLVFQQDELTFHSQIEATLRPGVRAEAESDDLHLGVTLESIDAIGQLDTGVWEGPLAMLLQWMLEGQTFVRVPRSTLDALVGDEDVTWRTGTALLPTPSSSPDASAIALFVRHDGDPVRPVDSGLPRDRELSLRIRGSLVAARLNEAAEKRRVTHLPLGFRVDHLVFSLAEDAVGLRGLLLRRWGRGRRGASGVRLEGRIRLDYDRRAANLSADVSELRTEFHGGFAWLSAVAAPLLTPVILGVVHAGVRWLGPGVIGQELDEALDSGEEALSWLFDLFAEETGLGMALYDVRIEGHDLVLLGDIGQPC